MKRILMMFSILLVSISMIFSVTSQEIIPLSSTIYSDMDALYLLTGNGTPSNTRPWSVSEASLILSRIDTTVLSGTAKKLYQMVESEINKGLRFRFKDGFQFDVSLDTNYEMYYHNNGDDFDKDTEWIYGFEDRKPLLKLDLSFAADDYLYIFTDLQYGRNRFTDRDGFKDVGKNTTHIIGSTITDAYQAKVVDHSWAYSQRFLTNVLWPTYDIDFQTPKRAVASFGGPHWNINLSRDKILWGNGHSGNFIIDDHVDYQEYARFNAFSDYFKYEWLNVFFETNSSVAETESADVEFKMLMAHRLEFRILDRITFAISENVMYQNDVFSFRYLNPAYIYHNINSNSMFNAIAHVELDISFAKGFNAYGQYVLDQAVAPNESDAQADATGWLAGIEYASVLGDGVLSASAEYAQTSPALYRRDIVDFLMFRRYHGNGTSFISHIDYIGYQYGGDAQVAQIDLSYRFPHLGTIGLRLFGMRHGQVDYFMSNAAVNANREPSPSGTEVFETGVASISFNLSLPEHYIPVIDLGLWGQLDWVGKRTYVKPTDSAQGYYKDNTQDIQLTTGISISF